MLVQRLPFARLFARAATALSTLAASALPLGAQVVINEIMYHPPDDRNELQWVELLNAGTAPVDLNGWAFTQGLGFTFTKPTPIPPGGFVVVARDLGGFRLRYGKDITAVGEFTGQLSHGGETLALADRSGKIVDSVKYNDKAPWPTSPDGGSTSLERIQPRLDGNLPENWAPSPMPEFRETAGSPGKANAASLPQLPPVISDVRLPAVEAGKPPVFSAQIRDSDGVKTATLFYQVLGPLTSVPAPKPSTPPTPEASLPLALAGGTATNGLWSVTLPDLPPDRVVRLRVSATDHPGAVRLFPHPDDNRPSLSLWTGRNANQTTLPSAMFLTAGPAERPGASLRSPRPAMRRAAGGQWMTSEPARGQSTLVFSPPQGGPVRVFDHIRVTPRQGGWKVRLNRDHPLDGMTTINVFDEGVPRYQFSEYLSYELYRAAGVATPLVNHWQVTYNGRAAGRPFLAVEQPNSSFFRRVQRPPESDLFKLLWYGRDLIGQHEKKNNPASGHAQLVETVEKLNALRGAKQWEYIERHFRVDEFASYYAVNMCIQNWDGFFNNYFIYREPGPDGRWGIIPWDEDKTWGDHDGATAQYDWYTMPITLGMDGDQPKGGGGGGGGMFGGLGFDAGSWWRPAGVFSGPLLANPEFRKRFKARLTELCTTTFTPEKMEPLIARLENDLDGITSNARGQGQFHRLAASFRRQVEHRRAFLLKELARKDP